MMVRYLKLYLKFGGSMEWFTIQKYPPKLKMLGKLNRMMARAPWEVTSDLIEEL